jgi:hypothetical protein
MNKPAEAEALFNRALVALGPVNSRLAWQDKGEIYSALLELYRKQPNKQAELEQTYARKLETMTELQTQFNNSYYRGDDYAPFTAAYYRTVREVGEFYLKKDKVRAETIYRLAFADPPKLGLLRKADQVEDYAVALETYQALLRELKKADEEAKLEELIKAARARQQELETRQKELEEIRRQPQPPPAPTKP